MREPTFWDLNAVAWTAVTGLATACLVLAALVAGIVGYRQLTEMRRAWRDEIRAYISVDFELNPYVPHVIEFVVRNSGRTAATNIRISWDVEPQRKVQLGQPFSAVKMLTDGIPTMAPTREIRILFDSTIERFNQNDLPDRYAVTVEYTDRFRKRHRDDFVLDVESYKGASRVGINTTHEIGKSVETIAKAIKSSGLAKGELGVVAEPRKENQARKLGAYKDWKRMRAGGSPRSVPRKSRRAGGVSP